MKRKNLFIISLITFSSIYFNSCDLINPPDDPPIVTVDSLGISVTEFLFTAEKDAGLLVVRSNISWTATENADWLTLSATSGNKNTGFLIGATVNPGFRRNATITITAGSKTKEILITQSAAPYINMNIKGTELKMILIEGGQFTMGSSEHPGFGTPHLVKLTEFYISETEISNACWLAVRDSLPYKNHSENDFPSLPVNETTWEDITAQFLPAINQLTGYKFDLPTEAQWEYAAMGGNKSTGSKYAGSNTLDDVAWYSYNSGWKKKNIKFKEPNELGLYDMSGNVSEWCRDWYHENYGFAMNNGNVDVPALQTDPTGPATGTQKIVRGGDFVSDETWGFSICHVKYRNKIYPSGYDKSGSNPDYFLSANTGFRLVLIP